MTSSSPRKSRSGPLSSLLKKLSPKLRPAATAGLDHARNRRGGGEEPVAVHRARPETTSPQKPPRPNGPEGAAERAVPLRKTDAGFVASSDGSQAVVGVAPKTTTQTSDWTQSSNPLITIEEIAPKDPPSIQVHRTLQPPRSLNLLSKITVKPPDINRLAGKMASIESIGSCSLDAEAVASESSSDVGGMASSMSQRTLCSINIEMNNCSSERSRQPSQVSSSPIKEKPEERPKQPSYLNISCSVSGYTSYSCYNSKAREGLRSRDNSPARFGVDSSKDTNGSLSNGANRRWSSTDHADVAGVGGAAEYGMFRTVSSSITTLKSTVTGYNNGTLSATVTEDTVVYEGVDETSKQTKSLIEQRIERLYGPGFLAQGFRIHRDRKRFTDPPQNLNSAQVPIVCRAPRDHPPVFRHLRKNFRDQLTGNISTVVSNTVASKIQNDVGDNVKLANRTDKVGADVPMSNGHHKEITELKVNGNLNGEVVPSPSQSGAMDGSAFIQVMNEERTKIESLISLASNDLASGTLPEDVCGRLRAAIGKANLLLTQKFEQFRGLCKKNINQDASEPFPTTVSDLAGFWDMVLIQVGDIKAMFEEIRQMRNNGWIIDDKVTVTAVDGEKPETTKHSRHVPKRPTTARSEEAAKAREESRKRLLEAKRKARLQRADSTNGSAPIEIFLPEKRD